MWASANRPDLARQEVKAALEANLRKEEGGRRKDEQDGFDSSFLLPPSSFWKAIGLENQGKTEDAKKIYEQLMKEAPNLSTGYLRLAALKEEAKDYAGALELLDKWLKLAPRDTSAFRGQVRVQAKNGKAEDAVKRGETFLKEERERLEKSFADSDKIQPAKDDKEKEQRAKNREQNLRTQEMVALINLVGGLMDAKAFDKAEPYVVKLLAMADKPPEGMSKDQTQVVQLFLGSYYLERGQKTKDKAAIDKAIELYEAVWKAAPGHPVAGNNLAWLMCMERKDPKAALAIIEKVRLGRLSGKPVSGDRLNAEILDTAGVVYNAAGKHDEELKLFEEAIQRYKNEPRVFVHLGRAYANQKKWGDAVENFNRGIEMADQKAQTVRDEERKAKLKELATKARAERDALGQTRR
jgi:tetratricopeptide (TPR) repeat protein